jgi:hypothetical protein
VKGLKEDITEEELQSFFEDPDEGINVTEVRLPKSRGGGSKGYNSFLLFFFIVYEV